MILFSGLGPAQSKAAHPRKEETHFRNTVSGVHYIGSKVCKSCHAEIFEKYFHTDMGNSMFAPSRVVDLGWLTTPIDIFNEHHNRHYQMYSRDSHIYQSEYELDEKRREVILIRSPTY